MWHRWPPQPICGVLGWIKSFDALVSGKNRLQFPRNDHNGQTHWSQPGMLGRGDGSFLVLNHHESTEGMLFGQKRIIVLYCDRRTHWMRCVSVVWLVLCLSRPGLCLQFIRFFGWVQVDKVLWTGKNRKSWRSCEEEWHVEEVWNVTSESFSCDSFPVLSFLCDVLPVLLGRQWSMATAGVHFWIWCRSAVVRESEDVHSQESIYILNMMLWLSHSFTHACVCVYIRTHANTQPRNKQSNKRT